VHLPYGMAELRPTRVVSADTVRCHVVGCMVEVPRQRRRFRADNTYLCLQHGIYLSPSTFQYRDPYCNLLWRDDTDRCCLQIVESVKRTMERLGRERDEDALTWNVVRAFEREGRLRALAELLTGEGCNLPPGEPQVIYWATDLVKGERWRLLEQAQCEFGESPERGTEPDAALYWPGEHLVFVEAKFCAPSCTTPSVKPRREDERPFSYGGHPHFSRAFKGSYHQIAVESRMYQLMRLWLLGSWAAKTNGAAFHLVNLVRWRKEADIETRFGGRWCRQDSARRFRRATWEEIWDRLPETGLSDRTMTILDQYLANKSAGYDSYGSLRRAFAPRTERMGGR